MEDVGEVTTAAACVVFDSVSALEGAVSSLVGDSLEMSMNSEPLCLAQWGKFA